MRIGRLSEPSFVFVCPLVEVIREADVNETSGEDGLASNCMMVNEFPSTACVGIDGDSSCGFGRVVGELQELHTLSLILLYSVAF